MTDRDSTPDTPSSKPAVESRTSPPAEIAPAAARRLGTVVLGLGLMIASTYVIPPLHALQPWKRGEGYVPYWNLVGQRVSKAKTPS